LGTIEGAAPDATEPPSPGDVSWEGAAAPAKSRKFPKMAVVLGAILVANALLAWAFAGTEIWNVVMTIAGGLLAAFFGGLVLGALRGDPDACSGRSRMGERSLICLSLSPHSPRIPERRVQRPGGLA
jgi:hypothetical protein